MKVLVVGDVVTDVLAAHPAPLAAGADTAASIRVTGGGSAANTACWLARQGVPVDLVGVAGGDAAGTDRIAELTAAGVGCAHVRRAAEAATGCVVVLVRGDERTMLSDRGANALLSPADVDGPVRDPDVSHVHVSAYVLLDPRTRPAGRHALATARQRGSTTSVGAASAVALRAVPDFIDLVHGTDLLLANADEARALLRMPPDPTGRDLADLGALAAALSGQVGTGEAAPGRAVPGQAAQGQAAPGQAAPGRVAAGQAAPGRVGHAVVTSGRVGAVWATGGAVVASAAGTAVEVVDATGAGDAFAGGVLANWLDGAEVADALRAGTALGAAAVGQLGARPS